MISQEEESQNPFNQETGVIVNQPLAGLSYLPWPQDVFKSSHNLLGLILDQRENGTERRQVRKQRRAVTAGKPKAFNRISF